MAKTRYTAEVRYSANMRALVGEVRRASREQRRSIEGVTRAVENQTRGWKGAALAITGLNQAMGLAARLGGGLVRAFAATAGAAAEQRSGVLQLDRALRASLGQTYEELAGRVEALTAAQQAQTQFGDEETRASMARVATSLIGVRVSYEQVERATRLVQDAQLALNKGQNEVIEQFASQINQGRDINELLDEMETRYGGAAAAIDEQSQAVFNLQNTWGDLLQRLGEALTVLTPLLQAATDALNILIEGANALSTSLQRSMIEAIDARLDSLDRLQAQLRGLPSEARFVLERFGGVSNVAEVQALIEQQRAALRQLQEELAAGIGLGGGEGEGEGGGAPPPGPGGRRPPGRRPSTGRAGPLGQPRSQAPGARGVRGFGSVIAQIAASAEEGVERLRAAHQLAQGLEMQRLDEEKRLIVETETLRQQAADKQTERINREIAEHRALTEARWAAARSGVDAALEFVGGVVGAERGFVLWRQSLAVVEGLWRALFGDLTGAARAAAVGAAAQAALGLAGSLIAGAKGGRSGGGGTPGRADSGSGSRPPPGALLSQPSSAGGGGPVTLQVRFDEDRARGALAGLFLEAVRNGEIRLS